jgi:hypothetical protein
LKERDMQPPDLYLVHLWQPKAGFRATARRVDEDQPHLFRSPEELVSFFGRRSEAAVPSGPAKSQPQPAKPGGVS